MENENPDMAQLPDDQPERPGAAPRIGVDVGSYGMPDHADHDEDVLPTGNRMIGIIGFAIGAALIAYGSWEALKFVVSGQ